MNLTTTLSSKGQITVPVAVARRIEFKPGMKVSIYPTRDGFRAVLHRPSRILAFAGDLQGKDKRGAWR
jgi:bifunctional DNA-binding transcriptional regulator/antitoxin component of YhaV-PrlF toxin-antitoxin module